jgi:hypothetical protein
MDYLQKINSSYIPEVKEFLKDDKIKYLIQGILILYISFWLPDTGYDAVASFESVIVRLVFTLLIVILSLIEEYTSAILLSLAFILSVQRLNKYKLNQKVTDA